MLKQIKVASVCIASCLLFSCQSGDGPQAGQLQVKANGEDFVRQPFTSKDGWQISFDQVQVHLSDITAYQTDPPFDPDGEAALEAQAEVSIPAETVDLAAGDETADPILVDQTSAPVGQYNALAWQVTQAQTGPAAGQALVMVGQATKDGRTVEFDLKSDRAFSYTCGEFVGDERKGVVQAGETADLEATFHFDHIFGDGEQPSDDEINVNALGFEPLAALADGQTLAADWTMLTQRLPPEQLKLLETALLGLGHVGEGHCRAEAL